MKDFSLVAPALSAAHERNRRRIAAKRMEAALADAFATITLASPNLDENAKMQALRIAQQLRKGGDA